MQWDFIFADLQVDLTFDAEATTFFGKLTDKDLALLRGIIYMSLCTFMYSKMPGVHSFIEDVKKSEPEKIWDKNEQDGG